MKSKISDKPRVLVVDDEENNRNLLTLILEKKGWEVSQAQDGKEALEKIFERQPDLLLLDYHMPKLTGGRVYQHLQLHGIKLAVVLISSHSELEELASSLGITYFLQKPFDISKLLTTIQSAYQHSLS
ncbi:response regulator [Nostoc sp. UIC 10630]|uniref:response regulator n=1 Tax=Nostoc sp. UIC 10630 TaxID=2100146 RepID=UPI0013D31FB9|nr:response regulator [Nostoc sp. UIC 10630]NEU81673.1 response regulator [Nostoc sp. UIC 10630]